MQGSPTPSRIAELGLDDRVSVLPFQPHWNVGRFIRSCHAVCFLERDFPIAVHSPTVPREVLRCGTCLVLSGEIAGNQPFQDKLKDGENYVRIDDPRDRENLAQRLAELVSAPDDAERIGAEGHRLAQTFAGFDDFIDAAEALFRAAIRGPGGPDAPARPDAASIAGRVPWLQHLMAFSPADFVADAGPEALPANEISAALAYCERAVGRIGSVASVDDQARLRDLLTYQAAHLRAQLDQPREPYPFARRDRLGSADVDRAAVAGLFPLLSRTCQFVEAGHPVAEFFEQQPEDRDETLRAFEALPREATVYCIHKRPNLRVRSFRIAEDARRLLESCAGDQTADQILTEFSGSDGDTGPVLDALTRFRDLHLIVFA